MTIKNIKEGESELANKLSIIDKKFYLFIVVVNKLDSNPQTNLVNEALIDVKCLITDVSYCYIID